MQQLVVVSTTCHDGDVVFIFLKSVCRHPAEEAKNKGERTTGVSAAPSWEYTRGEYGDATRSPAVGV